MKNFLKSVPMIAIFVMALTGAGCPGCPQPPDGALGQVLDCAGINANQAIPLIPKVNDCLTSAVDWKGCLISLINPASNITTEILACVTRDQGSKFAESADDQLEDTAACAADDFIRDYILGEKQMKFKGDYEPPEKVDSQVCGVLLQSRASGS